MAAHDQQPLGSGFHMKSEPDEVMSGINLSGRVAVVTGGYSGIGVETVRALTKAGAKVIVPARSRDKAEKNLADIKGDIVIADMDLADTGSVRSFADEMTRDLPQLDLLINNAGIMACPERRVGPGWEAQFGTNHMGHFTLTKALMPLLEKADSPRVVSLSSIAHKRNGILWDDINFEENDYDKWAAYAQAKSANALFALGLSRRMAAFGGRAFSVHPGGIFTPLQRDLTTEEQIELGWLGEDGQPSELARQGFKTPAQGCTTTLFAATSPLLNDKHGLYCEDGDVAQLADENSPPYFHVAPHVCDEESAERLWRMSEEMLKAA